MISKRKVKVFILLVLFSVLLMVLVIGCSNDTSNQSSSQLSIGTASMGGAFYPVGQEIANLMNKYVDGINVTAEVTGGAIENPRLIHTGDIEMGLTNSNLAYFAFNGEDPYTEKIDISAISSLHPSVLHIVTRSNSNINSVSDLKGKRVAVGPAGGGTIPILTALLEEAGLSMDDINDTYLSYADGFSQLSDSNVDVALALAGYPTSAVVEASTSNNLKFVNVDPELSKKVLEKYPYYSQIIVPKDVYGFSEDGVTIGVRNLLIVSNKLDKELVYQMTKAVFDHLDEFKEANANAKQIDMDSITETPIPLHPGAQKYFDELK